MTDLQWEFWFHSQEKALPPGIQTVDSQLRHAMRRLTHVPIRQQSLVEMMTNVDTLPKTTNIALFTHLDALNTGELQEIGKIVNKLKSRRVESSSKHPIHFCFVHTDPTQATEQAQTLRDMVSSHEQVLERLVCLGPRMSSRLRSQFPNVETNRIVEIGAGMRRPPSPPSDPPPEPILKPLPKVSNVRILFGSPTSPDNIKENGLDVFARAAGLVQRHFLNRRVNATFVVSSLLGRANSKIGPADRGLLRQFETWLRSEAKKEFDGITEFEVRELKLDRGQWLTDELQRADIFVLPNRNEPFGLVAAEALSMGKPVVATVGTGFAEALLIYASDSFLPVDKYVCALTPNALAETIEAVIADRDSRRLFRQVAEGMYKRLSWTNAVHRLLKELDLSPDLYKPTIDISEEGYNRATVSELPRENPLASPLNEKLLAPPTDENGDRRDVLFNIPVLRTVTLEEFPTNQGRSVELETAGTSLRIRKRILKPELLDSDSTNQRLEAQWKFVQERLNTARGTEGRTTQIYPKIYQCNDSYILMEYFDGGSIDQVENKDEAERLAGRAINKLLSASLEARPPEKCNQRDFQGSWDFCEKELRNRISRYNSSVAKTDVEPLSSNDTRNTLVNDCETYFQTKRNSVSNAPAPIHLAIHGDFGPNNVVFTSDPDFGERLVFIDTRARWCATQCGSVPYWDTVFDLATFFIFTRHIVPSISETFGTGSKSPLSKDDATLLRLIERGVRDTGYGEHDPEWRFRFEAACVVRLLGSISNQFQTAPEQGNQRANALVKETAKFIETTRSGHLSWE